MNVHVVNNSMMDKGVQFESWKIPLIVGILLVAIAALIVASLSGRFTPDSFWHLQMGRDWLENGLSPRVDHYSFTYHGHQITSTPVLFQGLMHLFTSQFGLIPGFQMLRLGFNLLTIGMSLLLLRQMKASAVGYVIVIPMIVFLQQLRVILRPELLSYALSIVALMLYFRAEGKVTFRAVAPMVILMIAWGNFHSSIVGYVIFFGFFLDCATAQYEIKAPATAWLKWFAWGLLIVAVGFLNFELSHPLIGAVSFSSEWKIRINEYLPPAPFLKSIAGIYILILFAIWTPIAAYHQRQFGLLVVWAVLTFSAVNMQRMVTPSGIIVVLIATYLYLNSKNTYRLKVSESSTWRNFVNLGIAVSIGVVLYSNIERAWFYSKADRSLVGQYPVAMVNYMRDKNMSGRVFNQYGIGGYLIYRFSGQVQVYIDGRTGILYPLEHMKKYEQLIGTKSPEVLRAELDKYAINMILWKYSQARQDLVQEMGGFGLDSLSAGFALYTRGTSNFPLFGELLSRPECWRSEMLGELAAERKKMDETLPEYSGLFPFADFVIGYSTADDGKAFFDGSIEGDEWMNEMRRFAGFRFLETGNFDLVGPLLGGVEIRRPKDYFASAFAMIKMENLEVATQVIDEFSSHQWPGIRAEDIFIYYKLYQLLETQRDLTPVEQNRVDVLKTQLIELRYQNFDSDTLLDVQHFCKDTELL